MKKMRNRKRKKRPNFEILSLANSDGRMVSMDLLQQAGKTDGFCFLTRVMFYFLFKKKKILCKNIIVHIQTYSLISIMPSSNNYGCSYGHCKELCMWYNNIL